MLKSRLNLFFLIYSVVALVVTFAVHFALYFGFNLRIVAPTVWTAIQFSILLTGVGVVICYRWAAALPPELDNEHSSVLLWLTIMFAVFLPYAGFNYFYNEHLMHFGNLDFVGRHHVIVYKGELVKAISPEELPAYQAYEARRYSGHWMICNVVLCILAFANVNPHNWKSKPEAAQ